MALAVLGRSVVWAFLAGGALWRDRLRGNKRVHMIHVGKTGGTAIKAALSGLSPEKLRFVLHPHRITLADIPNGNPCFFFVRDPMSRFVSGFFSRQRQGRPRYDIPWNDDERVAFTCFETPNALALGLSSPVDARRRSAEAAMRGIRHVKDHYWHWFGNEAYLNLRREDILFVGSQERLDADVEALSAILGVRIVLPTDEVSTHRNPEGVDRTLDSEARANLASWYGDDYAFLRLMRQWFPNLPDYMAAAADSRFVRALK
jgi:hypothetical protein